MVRYGHLRKEIFYLAGEDEDVLFESNVIIDERKNWAIGFRLLEKG